MVAAPSEIRLATEIAAQFRHIPTEEGAAAIAGHVRRFWDPTDAGPADRRSRSSRRGLRPPCGGRSQRARARLALASSRQFPYQLGNSTQSFSPFRFAMRRNLQYFVAWCGTNIVRCGRRLRCEPADGTAEARARCPVCDSEAARVFSAPMLSHGAWCADGRDRQHRETPRRA